MYLLVGLGNPGNDYSVTRHNVGFIFLDYLAEKYGFAFKSSKWQADVVKDSLWGKPVVLAKPQTFMNRSGSSVLQIKNYYQVNVQNLIVIHDDLDLDVGRIKIVTGRGAGGHNGIRSLIQHLDTNDFTRIKVGIGRPPALMSASNYVLSKFSPEEQKILEENLQNIEEAARMILEHGAVAAMNQINAKK